MTRYSRIPLQALKQIAYEIQNVDRGVAMLSNGAVVTWAMEGGYSIVTVTHPPSEQIESCEGHLATADRLSSMVGEVMAPSRFDTDLLRVAALEGHER